MIQKILVIVHPGSACGSADFNLGSRDAAAQRGRLVKDIVAWRGGAVVVDGFLSDELKLSRYAPLSKAIEQALGRARSAGKIAERVWGCDNIPPQMEEAVRNVVSSHCLSPDRVGMEVTGAWRGREESSGSVNAVASEFLQMHFHAVIRPSAIIEAF